MNYLDCFRALARQRTDQVVVTSAGNSSQAWWAVTRDSEATFYLDASMSLSTMFASGLALAQPELKIWAFMGDGAFCMNPGMLMVERQMNLRNLVHFLVSNRVYGATSNAVLPNFAAPLQLRRWVEARKVGSSPSREPTLCSGPLLGLVKTSAQLRFFAWLERTETRR